MCRCDREIPRDMKAKIALFCNVREESVITARDVETIYEVPIAYHEQGLDERIIECLNIWTKAPDLSSLAPDRQAGQGTGFWKRPLPSSANTLNSRRATNHFPRR
jgi:CTP synthase (UTP-ammonia lyase)